MKADPARPTNTDEEIVKLLALIAKRGASQSSVIVEMATLGFKPKRIAELLGTTSNTVNVALSTMRRKRRGEA